MKPPRQAIRSLSSSSPKSLQTGFTLLEVMVALTILTLAVATSFSALGGTSRLFSSTEQHQIAVVLAQAKMEEFLQQKSDVLSIDGDELIYRGVKYGFRVTSTPVLVGGALRDASTPLVTRLSQVQLEVFWGNPSSLRTYRVSTHKRKPLSAS